MAQTEQFLLSFPFSERKLNGLQRYLSGEELVRSFALTTRLRDEKSAEKAGEPVDARLQCAA